MNFLLSASFPGVEALREQARDARCIAESSDLIEFVVREDAKRAQTLAPAPVEANCVKDGTLYELLLFAYDGVLTTMELFAVPPKFVGFRAPALEDMTLFVRDESPQRFKAVTRGRSESAPPMLRK